MRTTKKALAEMRSSVHYHADSAISDFVDEVDRLMTEQGVSKAELARRLGVTKPYVTKVLQGQNFTVHTMAKIAVALDRFVRIHLAPSGVVVSWVEHGPDEEARVVESKRAEERSAATGSR